MFRVDVEGSLLFTPYHTLVSTIASKSAQDTSCWLYNCCLKLVKDRATVEHVQESGGFARLSTAV